MLKHCVLNDFDKKPLISIIFIKFTVYRRPLIASQIKQIEFLRLFFYFVCFSKIKTKKAIFIFSFSVINFNKTKLKKFFL